MVTNIFWQVFSKLCLDLTKMAPALPDKTDKIELNDENQPILEKVSDLKRGFRWLAYILLSSYLNISSDINFRT